MPDSIRIGIIGDFNPEFRSHHATQESLQHAAAKVGLPVESQWIPTPSLLRPDSSQMLQSFDGLWASPGSPYQNFAGMLRGIQFAREHNWPFLGTCGGFQYAFIELARNVLGIADADTEENRSGSKNIVIYPVACAVPDRAPGAPRLSGVVPEIRLQPGSRLHSLYNKDVVEEEYFCNFEINPQYESVPVRAGFQVAARGPQNEIRAIESPNHRFFLATLFQPQLSSTAQNPHPVIIAFLQAASAWSANKPASLVHSGTAL